MAFFLCGICLKCRFSGFGKARFERFLSRKYHQNIVLKGVPIFKRIVFWKIDCLQSVGTAMRERGQEGEGKGNENEKRSEFGIGLELG